MTEVFASIALHFAETAESEQRKRQMTVDVGRQSRRANILFLFNCYCGTIGTQPYKGIPLSPPGKKTPASPAGFFVPEKLFAENCGNPTNRFVSLLCISTWHPSPFVRHPKVLFCYVVRKSLRCPNPLFQEASEQAPGGRQSDRR